MCKVRPWSKTKGTDRLIYVSSERLSLPAPDALGLAFRIVLFLRSVMALPLCSRKDKGQRLADLSRSHLSSQQVLSDIHSDRHAFMRSKSEACTGAEQGSAPKDREDCRSNAVD
jgi:hypothetical protein